MRAFDILCFSSQAVGGFAGPVSFSNLVGHGISHQNFRLEDGVYHVTLEDGGMLQLAGNYSIRGDLSTLPPSTAIMIYVDSEEVEGLILGQGVIDSSAGEFSVTMDEIPTGKSKVYFSFSVLDPDQTPQYFGPNAVFAANVVRSDCTSPLTIKLDWNYVGSISYQSEYYWESLLFNLYIQEPDGTVVGPRETGVRTQILRNKR